jgi:DGQHR domain-containing protein
MSIINGYKNEVIAEIRNKYEEQHGYRETVFVFWTKNLKIEKDSQERAKELRIVLRDDFDLRYYKEALQLLQNRDAIRNSFLKDIKLQLPELSIFLEGHSINAKTVRTRIGSKTLYTFPIQVEYLLRFGYVFRVEMNSILGESYQRLLKQSKIQKIREYLQGGGYFPNNIVAVSEEPLQFTSEGQVDENAPFTLGELRLPNKPCYLEIIDGQHRLYSYSNQAALQNQCLWVTLVEGLTPIERAKLFVKINKTQTPVPPDILWDLYQISEPDGVRGRISKFVYELNECEPLKDLISLPRVRSSRAYLSFPNFCSSFAVRSRLFSTYGSGDSFKNVTRAFFEAIKGDGELQEDWNRSVCEKGAKGFICTNNSISVSLRLLGKVLERTGLPQSERIQTWKNMLGEWMINPLKEYMHENAVGDEEDLPRTSQVNIGRGKKRRG